MLIPHVSRFRDFSAVPSKQLGGLSTLVDDCLADVIHAWPEPVMEPRSMPRKALRRKQHLMPFDWHFRAVFDAREFDPAISEIFLPGSGHLKIIRKLQ